MKIMATLRGVWVMLACGVMALLLVGCAEPMRSNRRLVVQPFGAENTVGTLPVSLRELTFGTYNVQGMSDVDGLREDLAALSFVNAWGFQEVEACCDGADALDSVPSEVRQGFNAIMPPGSWYGVYLPLNARGGTWEGQAIVSRWPIVKAEVWPLEATGEKRRVALVAWLDTPGGVVEFVNTDHETALKGIGPEDRAKQVQSLMPRLMKEGSSMKVVAGDFNTSGDWLGRGASGEVAALGDTMGHAGFAAVKSADGAITFHAWPWYLKLDHMFVRDLSCQEGGVYEGRGSDHYPVWCRAVKVN